MIKRTITFKDEAERALVVAALRHVAYSQTEMAYVLARGTSTLKADSEASNVRHDKAHILFEMADHIEEA